MKKALPILAVAFVLLFAAMLYFGKWLFKGIGETACIYIYGIVAPTAFILPLVVLAERLHKYRMLTNSTFKSAYQDYMTSLTPSDTVAKVVEFTVYSGILTFSSSLTSSIALFIFFLTSLTG